MKYNDFYTYQCLAHQTAAKYGSDHLRLLILTLGLTGEAGEIAELVKKYVGHGHEIKREDVAKELGDVLWYLSELADAFGFDFSYIAEKNLEKLKKRYGEKFSVQASIERKDE